MSKLMLKRIFQSLTVFSLVATVMFSGVGLAEQAVQEKAAPEKTTSGKPVVETPAEEDLSKRLFIDVEPLALVKNPKAYLDKDVTFHGIFNRFSDIALDYDKALRESQDYVSLLILRPDVTRHDIPLSELKLFFPREKSADVVDLESGDQVVIKGNVFSSALNEPWVDVLDIDVVGKPDKVAEKKDPTG